MIHYIGININKNGVLLPVYSVRHCLYKVVTDATHLLRPVNRWIGVDDIFVLSHTTIQSVKLNAPHVR